MTWPLMRGQVIRADIGLDEPKLFVVVSNSRRNRQLGDVLGARLTTSNKPGIPSIVELRRESLTGRVVCDDILAIYEDEVLAVVAALPPERCRQSGTVLLRLWGWTADSVPPIGQTSVETVPRGGELGETVSRVHG